MRTDAPDWAFRKYTFSGVFQKNGSTSSQIDEDCLIPASRSFVVRRSRL
jgi:hypothetical protein